MTYQKLTRVAAGALALLAPGILLADSISPSSYSDTVAVGESVTITKEITVTAGKPTTSKVDVFFLADTTGSMGGAIANVRANANTLLNNIAGLGDVAFGVGEYKDFYVPGKDWGSSGDYDYMLRTGVTTVKATAQAAINAWGADGGADGPESQLSALDKIATEAGSGWRDGAAKIIVWFGDYEGHDPNTTPGYPGPTLATTITHLNAKNIEVEAINVGYGRLDALGQATAITLATGGTLYNGIDVDDLTATIEEAITTSFSTYNSVSLDLSEVPAGVGVVSAPTAYVGTYDRSIQRTFLFDVTFTGMTPGTYSDFPIYAKVDSGRVATETDSITVKGSGVPDGGSTLLLLGGSLMGLAALRRKM